MKKMLKTGTIILLFLLFILSSLNVFAEENDISRSVMALKEEQTYFMKIGKLDNEQKDNLTVKVYRDINGKLILSDDYAEVINFNINNNDELRIKYYPEKSGDIRFVACLNEEPILKSKIITIEKPSFSVWIKKILLCFLYPILFLISSGHIAPHTFELNKEAYSRIFPFIPSKILNINEVINFASNHIIISIIIGLAILFILLFLYYLFIEIKIDSSHGLSKFNVYLLCTLITILSLFFIADKTKYFGDVYPGYYLIDLCYIYRIFDFLLLTSLIFLTVSVVSGKLKISVIGNMVIYIPIMFTFSIFLGYIILLAFFVMSFIFAYLVLSTFFQGVSDGTITYQDHWYETSVDVYDKNGNKYRILNPYEIEDEKGIKHKVYRDNNGDPYLDDHFYDCDKLNQYRNL